MGAEIDTYEERRRIVSKCCLRRRVTFPFVNINISFIFFIILGIGEALQAFGLLISASGRCLVAYIEILTSKAFEELEKTI